MRRFIIITLTIIFIPFLIVTLFVKEKEMSFSLVTNDVVRVKRDKLNRIDTIPLEEYIVGVVAGEMPVSFNLEALKAQAVAARNYAIKKILYNKDKEYDLIDTTANQVYLDTDYLKESWKDKYIENINKVRKAVSDTKQKYLVYEDKVIDLFYFSTSNGKTENVENVFKTDLPYLKSVDSPWDEFESSVFNDTKTFEISEFYNLLGIENSNELVIKDIRKSESNRVLEININGNLFTGREIYQKLSIRSTDFEIEQINNQIIIKTKGFGHGVGMSQYGANGMAKEGYTYEQILKHYYQGTSLKKIKNFENNV
ncbi:MAG: stage II sporulation protein D [Bacilli bacterium]|nr:stage II sporulation protein D [Bacilli bacterium]